MTGTVRRRFSLWKALKHSGDLSLFVERVGEAHVESANQTRYGGPTALDGQELHTEDTRMYNTRQMFDTVARFV